MVPAVYDFDLAQTGVLSTRLREKGLTTFAEACTFVQGLPYRRPTGPASSIMVLDQACGTCSSKHALLAGLAEEAERSDCELTLGYLQLNESNSPGIGPILRRYSLPSIPEAHCYLRTRGVRNDFTGLPPGSVRLVDSVTREEPIDIDSLHTDKRRRHERYLLAWATEREIPAELTWTAREAWIKHLSTALA